MNEYRYIKNFAIKNKMDAIDQINEVFFKIQKFMNELSCKISTDNESQDCMLFISANLARVCVEFMEELDRFTEENIEESVH